MTSILRLPRSSLFLRILREVFGSREGYERWGGPIAQIPQDEGAATLEKRIHFTIRRRGNLIIGGVCELDNTRRFSTISGKIMKGTTLVLTCSDSNKDSGGNRSILTLTCKLTKDGAQMQGNGTLVNEAADSGNHEPLPLFGFTLKRDPLIRA